MSRKLKAIELAKLLDVAQATVSGAAINDYLCSGYPVADWADKNVRGRIMGYDVPEEIYRELVGEDEQMKSIDRDERSDQVLRDRLFNKWYEMIDDIESPEESLELEKKVEERFSGIALEEFERAQHVHFDNAMTEIERLLAEAVEK